MPRTTSKVFWNAMSNRPVFNRLIGWCFHNFLQRGPAERKYWASFAQRRGKQLSVELTEAAKQEQIIHALLLPPVFIQL
ncbi:MAG TPA: hypothetical protein VFA02_11910, partial [Pseudacidobacterium sp.]|nr:hypothetical protein [Pseudacidobacterium sp.]